MSRLSLSLSGRTEEEQLIKYIEDDDVYELKWNNDLITMVDAGDGKMNFFCQCGYHQNHLKPCRHYIKSSTLINRENKNKDKIHEHVDDI